MKKGLIAGLVVATVAVVVTAALAFGLAMATEGAQVTGYARVRQAA